ncbi:10163_t:CDS:2 [Ambispora leptoticha]|uniref:10163_t:CDS:1 n=1 Tax=Ambispora leptoticha TaxID=144679 RepID=A0A9N9GMF5_9GLOM|nr:10163_t:CDS:2 [Ambispora leptoticha]
MTASKSKTFTSSTTKRRNRSEIDTTGRRSIFQVRGVSYPPRRRARSNKQNFQIENNENEISEEVIRMFETHIDVIEEKVNVLTESSVIQNTLGQISDKLNTKVNLFSELSTEELLKLTRSLSLLNNDYAEQNMNTIEPIEQQNEEQRLKLQQTFLVELCNNTLLNDNIFRNRIDSLLVASINC